MQATIDRVGAPFESRLQEPIAESRELLYRRGNFNGAWDQLIVEALLQVKEVELAFSPGFRWGTTLLPGEMITREKLMEQTAITYPDTSIVQKTGAEIKQHREKLCDKIFNEDPYQQQGGGMVRTGGLVYTCEPGLERKTNTGRQVLQGGTMGFGSAQGQGEPVWYVFEQYL